jgi:hypothetical protein
MVNYQNKCRLIRGWDDLFNKLKENINQVSMLQKLFCVIYASRSVLPQVLTFCNINNIYNSYNINRCRNLIFFRFILQVLLAAGTYD